MRHTLQRVNETLAVVAALCVLGMMLVGAIDILGSWLLKKPLPGAFEITEELMVAGIFLGFASAQLRNQHIRAEVLTNFLAPRLARGFDRIGCLLMALLFGFILWYGWAAFAESFRSGEYSSGIVKLPLWPPKLALVVGSAAMLLQCLTDGLLGRAPALARRVALE